MRKHSTFKEIVLDPVRREKARRFIFDGLESGALWPKIDKVFAFDQIVEAYRYLETNQKFG